MRIARKLPCWVALIAGVGCSNGKAPPASGGATGLGGAGVGLAGASGMGGAASETGGTGGAATALAKPVVISGKVRTPVTTTRSINYWMWAPTYGDDVTGTEAQIAPLGLELLRVGGYNNDANTPDPFDDAQVDRAVAYARAIGAEPLLQVPLLADELGMPPTADTARAMVEYANVTKKYGIKYFSIGNEPDMYARQGGLLDPSAPAIAGYTPADYCVSAKAYASAMKTVDPTIQIVGPDLAYQYTASSDWLSPVLRDCGDVFDVIAIHRYPFSAKMATLAAAAADVAAFRKTVAYVHGLMTATGYAAKPLAFTEMNIDYDELPSSNIPAAVAGSVPSALWVADILGASQELALRTTTLWSISDDESRQFGLLGGPPPRTPRPQYYTYRLFAQHSGPTRLSLTSAPSGVHVYPTRNAADDTTQAIVVNWQTSAEILELTVTDLDNVPTPVTYTVPGVSLTAVDIPDSGAASAVSFGLAEYMAGTGPAPLAEGARPIAEVDAGAPPVTSDAGDACSQVTLAVPTVTTVGSVSGDNLIFGPESSQWVSFKYAGNNQTAPSTSVTTDGNGFALHAELLAPLSSANNFAGYGMYFNSSSCLDASKFSGIEFDLAGDLGGCSLRYLLQFAQDLSYIDDPGRGHCQNTDAVCLGPWAPVTASANKIRLPFSSFSGGAPIATVDPKNLVTMQWQVSATSAASGCAADITVKNVNFY